MPAGVHAEPSDVAPAAANDRLRQLDGGPDRTAPQLLALAGGSIVLARGAPYSLGVSLGGFVGCLGVCARRVRSGLRGGVRCSAAWADR